MARSVYAKKILKKWVNNLLLNCLLNCGSDPKLGELLEVLPSLQGDGLGVVRESCKARVDEVVTWSPYFSEGECMPHVFIVNITIVTKGDVSKMCSISRANGIKSNNIDK